MIDMLEILQQKTEGNRTPEETEDIEAMLYQLRMAYVQVMRQMTKPKWRHGPGFSDDEGRSRFGSSFVISSISSKNVHVRPGEDNGWRFVRRKTHPS